VADSKGLEFVQEFARDLPRAVHTDAKRLQQSSRICSPMPLSSPSRAKSLCRSRRQTRAGVRTTKPWRCQSVLAFSVSDTGIGVPPDKQQSFIEAFQQPMNTSQIRSARVLGWPSLVKNARLLGGEIRLVSAPGAEAPSRSILPQNFIPGKTSPPPGCHASSAGRLIISSDEGLAPPQPELFRATNEPARRRTPQNILPGDRVLMIVENDAGSARLLLGQGTRERLERADSNVAVMHWPWRADAGQMPSAWT